MQFRYTLENYNGTKSRFDCPNCGRREFVRYLDRDTGDRLDDSVGRCNRESSCGYHRTPKQFFADNPPSSNPPSSNPPPNRRTDNPTAKPAVTGKNDSRRDSGAKSADFIAFDVFRRSLTNYRQNGFIQFLLSNFDESIVLLLLRRYFVGTSRDGRAVFWQLDRRGRVRTGKLIAYDAMTGKRLKKRKPSFVHAELKRAGKLDDDFNLKQCFFGEHLLINEPEKPVAIVESEKTAMIASIFLPSFIWLACGSKAMLTPERLQKFDDRRIVLYPDADGFEMWTEKAIAARAEFDLQIVVSDLIEFAATAEEKAAGFDLADYLLIAGRRDVERTNAAIDQVLGSDELFNEFESIINERIAIAEIDGNLSEAAAREVATNPDAVRSLALKLANR